MWSFVTNLFHLAYFQGSSMLYHQYFIPFSWLNNIPPQMYTHFVYSSVDRHLGGFHFLAIMNNAAMSICLYIFV